MAVESGGNLATLAGCVNGSKLSCEVVENSSAEQTLSIATIASQDSNSYDTINYKSFSVIVESDTADQQVQLQWSHDNTNFYQLTPYNTTNSVNDEQGANPQHIYSVYGDVLAKYFKVAVYNPGLSTASTKVIVYLVK